MYPYPFPYPSYYSLCVNNRANPQNASRPTNPPSNATHAQNPSIRDINRTSQAIIQNMAQIGQITNQLSSIDPGLDVRDCTFCGRRILYTVKNGTPKDYNRHGPDCVFELGRQLTGE